MGPTSAPELVAMMLADSRFPSGGFAQSGGLEAALRAGLEDVPAYARGRLRTVAGVDAGTAVVARHRARFGLDLAPVADAWAARTPSRRLRETARETGRGYLRLAGRLWPDTLAHLDARRPHPRPVVVGVVAAVTGLHSHQVARLVGYDDVQTVCSAALKLVPLDPADVAGWALSLHQDVEAMVRSVAGLTDPDDIPDHGAPMVDAHAEAHARAEMRLFRV